MIVGRRSLRLKTYDYAWSGGYYVTLCVDDRSCRIGEIVDGACVLSEAGLMVESWWNTIPGRFPTVSLDAYVVMPNHFHGVLVFGRSAGPADRTGRPPCLPCSMAARSETTDAVAGQEAPSLDSDIADAGEGRHGGLPVWHSETVSLGRVMQWFKSATTHDYGVGVRDYGWPPYERRLWHRNYYEHVVRDEADLDRIRAYIAANPARWTEDEEYRKWMASRGSRTLADGME